MVSTGFGSDSVQTPKAWVSAELITWLTAIRSQDQDSYRHLLLTENPAARPAGLESLAALIREAHRDARERLERLTSRSLDPLDPNRNAGTPSYPDDLETTTLQGYLGEVLAGLVAENYSPHDRSWHVPAFLFRNHHQAYQALERARQQGTEAKRAPGRTGDDALAFEIDESGRVTRWLFAEAKCTATHSSGLIAEGHEKLSEPDWLPVDLAQLIEILESKNTAEGTNWANALRLLNAATEQSAPPRDDVLVYVCGQKPKRAGRTTWISSSAAHEKYKGGGRHLEAVEVQLDAFSDVIKAVYPRGNHA